MDAHYQLCCDSLPLTQNQPLVQSGPFSQIRSYFGAEYIWRISSFEGNPPILVRIIAQLFSFLYKVGCSWMPQAYRLMAGTEITTDNCA